MFIEFISISILNKKVLLKDMYDNIGLLLKNFVNPLLICSVIIFS